MEAVVLGQFIPGKSLLHRLDPRSKMILSLVLIWQVFLLSHPREFVLFGILVLLLYGVAGIGTSLLRVLKPGIYLILFTLIINMIFIPGEPIVNMGFVAVSREGLVQGLTVGCRLVYLLAVSSLLTLTTSPLLLTHGLERLLRPLRKMGVPAAELAMMMSIALRFIPIFWEETEKLSKAQMARGADFNSWHPLKRMKYLMALLVPLLLSAFRKADELSLAMEARGYTVGMERTSLHEFRLHLRDYLAIALGVISLGLTIVFN